MPTDLSVEDLLDAYRTMKTIREFEDRVHVEFAKGGIPGFVHLYAGEEASATGICMHLKETDAIASNHRGHGHCIAKGVEPIGMMAEIYGKKTGTCHGIPRSDSGMCPCGNRCSYSSISYACRRYFDSGADFTSPLRGEQEEPCCCGCGCPGPGVLSSSETAP